MTLDPHTPYPNSRHYVLKLHRDASSAPEHLCGRLESLITGRHCDFRSASELLAALSRELAGRPSVGGPVSTGR